MLGWVRLGFRFASVYFHVQKNNGEIPAGKTVRENT